MHALLNGDFARAIYFNWIAFPIVAAALAVLLIAAAEASHGRDLVRGWFSFHLTRRRAAFLAGAVAALWIFQVAIAVGLQKRELLNGSAPLTSLFVR
ncbi:hypothetical protein BH18VER1_BH18VER1_10080 [soil metagenome]